MMSVYLLANVGDRDVKLRGEVVKPARYRGKEILDRLEEQIADLSLPLLTPVVRELLRRHKRIEVVLFATDQPEDTLEKYREGDTLYFAEIAGKLLKPPVGPKGVERVWIKRMQVNPSLYDDTLAYFQNMLSPKQSWTKQVETCYAYPVGGTPAANMGLLLAALESFGERCSTLYLPQGENYPIEMDLGGRFRRGIALRLARDRLNTRSFGAAASLLQEAGAPRWVACVAQYCSYRYHFDFEAASKSLERAKAVCGGDSNARVLCERLRRDLLRLRDRDQEALLLELYHNGQIAYERGEFAAFLGIVFRLQEAVLRHLIEKLYDIPTDVYDDETRKRFVSRLETYPRLLDYLKGRRVDGSPLRYDRPDREVFRAILRYAWEGSGESGKPELVARSRTVYDLLQRLDCLSTRRNKSIIAHGFEGVSREKILDDYKREGHRDEPLLDMASALEALGIRAGENPFHLVAGSLLEDLEKL